MTPSPGIELSAHWWKKGAITTAQHCVNADPHCRKFISCLIFKMICRQHLVEYSSMFPHPSVLKAMHYPLHIHFFPPLDSMLPDRAIPFAQVDFKQSLIKLPLRAN